MKAVILLVFCFFGYAASAQRLPDYGLDKVRINEPGQNIVAELAPISASPSAKPGLHYFWYNSGAIHETQGGYSGRLLNGQYTAFYLNKNLKEQGIFKKGLKDGIWKSWREDGSLLATVTWKRGKELTGRKLPLWKRLPLIRKKFKKTDSLNNIKPPAKQ